MMKTLVRGMCWLGLMVVLHMHYVPQLAAVRPGINLFDKMAHGGVRKHVVRPDYTGYIPVNTQPSSGPAADNSSIYYAFYEAAADEAEDVGQAPIVLWLQGGPGCASSFGGLYEVGPYLVTDDLQLVENPGSWSRKAGLLLMDQPVGTGLSYAASDASIPTDEMGMATHLYAALQGFFTKHWHLQQRPLFITGESYAGKYVPSIAHYVLQASQKAGAAQGVGAAPVLRHTRNLPPHISPPVFTLKGIAIGNGLTEPRAQTLSLATTAWSIGLLASADRDMIAQEALQVVGLIDDGKWQEAHDRREKLRVLLTNVSGISTMFDIRRVEDYDAHKAVDRYLDLPEVREAMGAKQAPAPYKSCSDRVAKAMAADTMKSVAHLIPDVLDHLHLLLYQGQYDILDGPTSNTVWLEALEGWPGATQLRSLPGTLWRVGTAPVWLSPRQQAQQQETEVQERSQSAVNQLMASRGLTAPATAATAVQPGASRRQEVQRSQHMAGGRGCVGGASGCVADGWWRSVGRLTHAVVYRAGHMVPTDAPEAAQYLMEQWIMRVMGDAQ